MPYTLAAPLYGFRKVTEMWFHTICSLQNTMFGSFARHAATFSRASTLPCGPVLVAAPPPATRQFCVARPKARVNREQTSGEKAKKTWLGDPGTYPVIGVIVVAVALATGQIIRASRSPDVQLNKMERSTVNYLENEKDHKHAEKMYSHLTTKVRKD